MHSWAEPMVRDAWVGAHCPGATIWQAVFAEVAFATPQQTDPDDAQSILPRQPKPAVFVGQDCPCVTHVPTRNWLTQQVCVFRLQSCAPACVPHGWGPPSYGGGGVTSGNASRLASELDELPPLLAPLLPLVLLLLLPLLLPLLPPDEPLLEPDADPDELEEVAPEEELPPPSSPWKPGPVLLLQAAMGANAAAANRASPRAMEWRVMKAPPRITYIEQELAGRERIFPVASRRSEAS
jgi:hypothetical protein